MAGFRGLSSLVLLPDHVFGPFGGGLLGALRKLGEGGSAPLSAQDPHSEGDFERLHLPLYWGLFQYCTW
jgi:hypothetical protein